VAGPVQIKFIGARHGVSITRVPDVEPSGKYSAMFLPEHGMERYSQKIGLCGAID